ncbi:LUD domain-containing protein [Nocardioides perillae]|uniref:L-lactate dehydrogenase complex protein LldG n=1 Tax=Nocardioides perillae TaxID=1119534 RepID=A0A7Y9RUX5_9ACTN|nr:L-lactate dehydrogenase complex protein LldG [Nocardioides perillae]
MSAREEVLGRVRAALADVAPQARAAVAPTAPRVPERPHHEVVDLFCERVADYRAVVERCAVDELGDRVAAALAGAARVVVPPGLADVALPPGLTVVVDGEPDVLGAAELDAVDAVVTAARVGIAETGTVVLDHAPDQGRRALTLVPDLHVCVVREEQVVADVPDALPLLDPARPLTWISGPSATSDIELSRVEGVHGPRTLHVLVVADREG